MNIRPIPKHLLIHSVDYHEKLPAGRHGSAFADPVEISNVLVQFGTSIKRKTNSNGVTEEQVIKALMFMDALHTQPFIILEEGSKVFFDGQEFIVDFVERVYTTKLHHYEVRMR